MERAGKRVRPAHAPQAAALIEAASANVLAYRASIIHSKTATDAEMLPDALLVVDHGRGGLILDLVDVEGCSEAEVQEAARECRAKEVKDFRGRIIMPGFIDTHAHAPQYAFTGTGMHLPLLKW
jgi:guanine deaminase